MWHRIATTSSPFSEVPLVPLVFFLVLLVLRSRFVRDRPGGITDLCLLELLSEFLELLFQIVEFFFEFADSIRFGFRLNEPYFTGKKMRVTDFLLTGLPWQANNKRGIA